MFLNQDLATRLAAIISASCPAKPATGSGTSMHGRIGLAADRHHHLRQPGQPGRRPDQRGDRAVAADGRMRAVTAHDTPGWAAAPAPAQPHRP
jgi:hypothetical protein